MGAPLKDRAVLEPSSVFEWHDWLAANHASSPGVWLAIGKKRGRAEAISYDAAVEEALCWGWIDSVTRRLDADRFLQSFTPRRPGGTWSRSNKQRVDRLIAEGRMQPSGQAIIDAARASGMWTALDEVDALIIPDDLAAALAPNAEAAAGFDRLGESSKKQVLWWIASAKRPTTRTERIAATVDAATRGSLPR